MVRGARPRSAVAADSRPLLDPRLGGHAPADPGPACRTAKRGVARALADGRGARRGAACRRDSRLAGTRLQPPRREPAPGCPGGRGSGWPEDLSELPGVGPYTAAAVASFALGAEVLPVDTNVLRVQRRTGRAFDHECAQALFDLGREVCLARVPRCGVCPLANACPSRGSRDAPARKQGRFEGSFRQRRAKTLRLVAAAPRAVMQLDEDAVRSLAGDGLVAVEDGLARLPE